MRKDHKVNFRTEESIKWEAERVRAALEKGSRSDFSITDCFRKLTKEKILKGNSLDLRFFQQKGDEPPAFVEFKPSAILNVDKDVWDEADENIPRPRRILGHELGHLCLHDHYAQPFSEILDKKVWMDEESAEWQADRFAEYFLVSDADVRNYVTPSSIAAYCAVEYEIAFRRLGRRFRFTDNLCPNCGNLAMVRNGACLKCDTCGGKSSELGPYELWRLS